MKYSAHLPSLLFIFLFLNVCTASPGKEKLASIQKVVVHDGEDPYGRFRDHLQTNNLTPRTIAKNCRELPCDSTYPCPSQCGVCTLTKKHGLRCTTHPDTAAQQSGCSGLGCFGGRRNSRSNIGSITRL